MVKHESMLNSQQEGLSECNASLLTSLLHVKEFRNGASGMTIISTCLAFVLLTDFLLFRLAATKFPRK